MATDSGIPGHFPHQLAHWWEHGEGAAEIRWGERGDFDRCVRLAVADAHMTPERAKGFCNERHHAVLGIYPATHAKLERGRSSQMAESSRAQMTSQSINDLPDSDFAYIEPGGSKDSSGKTVPRSLRHFPIHDAAHVRNALSRAPQSPFGEKAMPKIRAAAKKFGIDAGGDSSDSSTRSSGLYTRSYPLEDLSIKPGDGRTVEAYATVFNVPSPVRDRDGDYEEIIDPAAFNRALEHARRAKGGWNIPVLFNHGMTIYLTPSEKHSVPIGVPEEIRADSRGLFTRTRFHKTAAADEVLEAIKDGSITGYSFQGAFKRSDPMVPRGGFRADHAGRRTTVRRMESTLREFGPATFRVHDGAEVLGVRAEQAALLLGNLAPGEFDRLAELFRSGTPLTDSLETGTPTDVGPAADDPPHGHSTRSPRQELQARRARFLIEHGG